jgi:hypothetical protein
MSAHMVKKPKLPEDRKWDTGIMDQRINFVVLPDSVDITKLGLINLDQIRLVNEIKGDHCKIWFSETHHVEINGTGATEFLTRLFGRAMTLDGTPYSEIGKAAKSE